MHHRRVQLHDQKLYHMLPTHLLAVLLAMRLSERFVRACKQHTHHRPIPCHPYITLHQYTTHLLAVLLAMRLSERLVSARSPRMLPTTACSCCRLLLSDDAASDCAAPAVRLLSASQVVNAVST
jgi:hypothetical protein